MLPMVVGRSIYQTRTSCATESPAFTFVMISPMLNTATALIQEERVFGRRAQDTNGNHHEGSISHQHIGPLERNRKALWVAICVTASVMVLEVVGGFLSNSLALLSDAGHMLTDLLALVLSLVALRLSTRPPSPTKTYGFYRTEILAAFVNGTALVLISAYILYQAYQRLRMPEAVEVSTMLGIAVLGLIANGVAAFAMAKASGDNLNIRGAYLHVLGDALSSLGVIVGGVVILVTSWYWVDPIISVLICLVILRGALALVKDSANILLEAVPKGLELGDVVMTLRGIEGVNDLHDVHIWTIGSGFFAMSAHVLVDDVLTSRAGDILAEINRRLKEDHGIVHTTIQFECRNCEEGIYCDASGACVAISRVNCHNP